MEDFKMAMLQLIKIQSEQEERRLEAQAEQQKADREFKESLLIQQQRLQEQQLKSEERILLALNRKESIEDSEIAFSQTAVWNAIETFSYVAEEDKTFSAYFRRYEDLYRVDCGSWTESKKTRLLLSKLGSAEHTKFVDFILPRKTGELAFNEAVELLSELFSPKTSLFHKRWKCLNLMKNDEEDYISFASSVNKHCDDFKLADLTSDNFKCLIFVQGLVSQKSAEIRRRVLSKLENEPGLTLQKLAEDCQRFVSLKKDSQNIETGVAYIKKLHQRTRQPDRKAPTNIKTERKPPTSQCYRCGQLHWSNVCPYLNKKCFSCKKTGHCSSKCRSRNKVNKVQMASSNSEDEDNKRKYVIVNICNKKIKMQLDSGSDLSIIDLKTWKTLNRPTLTRTRRLAKTVTGEKIQFEGEFSTHVSLNEKTKKLNVCVVKHTENLFGTDWMGQFKLWDVPISSFCQKVQSSTEAESLKESLKKDFPQVFSAGLGKCIKMKAKFQLKQNATPTFRKKRNVPFATIKQIDIELKRLVDTGILSKIENSQWAAPTVYVKKKSKEIRVCADFSTGLNESLEDYHYPLPSPEEIFTKLNGGQIFSKIDLSDAYLQVPVDENCSNLLCINTHKGLYKFNRLAFGVKVAPAIFQEIMDSMLQGLDFAMAYLDDIIVSSKSTETHHQHVQEVFSRINNYGFKVKETKCDFFLHEIKYLGHIINRHGRKPDPERATAIKDMPAPTNISELQSFLGLANYYQVFIKNMHDLRAPLNKLLKKDQPWHWSSDCQTVFEKIKETLTSDLFLTHYNPNLEIVVASDASSYGLGACMLHKMPNGNMMPIAHASRSLLPAERQYSQIEKEALAIIFAVTKFHRYIYGRFFTLQTDHKPLITIFGSKKGLPTYTANRLLRWGTILLNYNFKLQYLPSKNICHADGLSRLVKMKNEILEESVIASIRAGEEERTMMCNTISELPVTLREIRNEAEKDDFIITTKNKMLDDSQNVSNSFSIIDNVLMYNDRVVIPSSLQTRILKDFHKGHPGRSRMKTLMRSFVFWNNMDADINQKVDACKGCALAAKAPAIVHKPWPKTDQPWSRIHLDFAGPVDGFHYLIVVDAFSKWPEVLQCRRPTSEVVMNFLFELFARFGVVDCVVTDNGTQFTSADFENFCSMYSINHITTPPYHPRSNGQAERFVDTLKRALKKASGTPSDKALQQFLQVYRITRNDNTTTTTSPAEAMFGRKIRSVFDKLIPVQTKPIRSSPAPKKKYAIGEKVFFKAYKNNLSYWEPGIIEKKCGSVIYQVQGPKFVHKRHINQLRPRKTDDTEVEPQQLEQPEPIDTVYDLFDLEPPQPAPDNRRSGRKRKIHQPFLINPKKKKYE